jgi:subtilisin-like proprotein convertase family protein
MGIMERLRLERMHRTLARGLVPLTFALAVTLISMGSPRIVSAERVYQTSNTTLIAINDDNTASPYPSSILVSGVVGNITKVTVTLTNLSHGRPSDIDIMLVSAGARDAVIFSDAGDGVTVNNVTLTLDDDAVDPPPFASGLTSGTFKPVNYNPPADPDNFVNPAPAPSGNVALATFIGDEPNGTWELFVVDSVETETGSIAGGWTLTITTDAPPVMAGDLVSIKKSATDSGQTEVHVLSGADEFQSFSNHIATVLHQTDDTWAFAVADWDGDTVPDVVGIKKSLTGSGSTEVHVLSGTNQFQTFSTQLSTALQETDNTWAFGMIGVPGK